jgi:hypothetical protein
VPGREGKLELGRVAHRRRSPGQGTQPGGGDRQPDPGTVTPWLRVAGLRDGRNPRIRYGSALRRSPIGLRHRIRDGIQGTSFAFPKLNDTANFTITGMGELLLVRRWITFGR